MPPRGTKKMTALIEDAEENAKLVPMYRVPTGSLKPYPGNPRKGNVKEIKASLLANGQFKPILVRKSDMTILGGNHTWQGVSELMIEEPSKKNPTPEQWATTLIVYAEDVLERSRVTDEEAARIVLADNRTSDLATYDRDALSRILEKLPNPDIGTGYSKSDVSSILDRTTTDLSHIMHPPPLSEATAFGSDSQFQAPEDDNRVSSSGIRPEPGEAAGDEQEEKHDLFKEAEGETAGVFGLKDDLVFSSSSPWGIPDLRPDMFVEKLPEVFDTWAGSATKDDPREDVWWLYNYGIDSTSGMRDPQKMVLAFYTFDDYFFGWWKEPAKMMTKALNAGITMAVSPNFSQWTGEPKALTMFSLYRSRWLARYFQEVGIKIIPDLNWLLNDQKWLIDFVLAGIPKGVPIVGMEMQTYEKEEEDAIGRDIRTCVETLECGTLMLYSGEPGRDFVERLRLPCDVHWMPNRLIALGKQAKERKAQIKEDEKSGKRKPRIK